MWTRIQSQKQKLKPRGGVAWGRVKRRETERSKAVQRTSQVSLSFSSLTLSLPEGVLHLSTFRWRSKPGCPRQEELGSRQHPNPIVYDISLWLVGRSCDRDPIILKRRKTTTTTILCGFLCDFLQSNISNMFKRNKNLVPLGNNVILFSLGE